MEFRRIAVLNTGGSEARALARKIRALQTLAVVENASERAPDAFFAGASGIVIVGKGPDAEAVGTALSSGLPVLALGSAARAVLLRLGGEPGETLNENGTSGVRFFGHPLFEGLTQSERYLARAEAWTLPPDCEAIAEGEGGWTAGFMRADRRIFALQFGVESNDPDGMQMLNNFLRNVCGLSEEWTMPAFLDDCVERLRASCSDGTVVAAVSGGAPSVVASALAARAFGGRLRCVLCDTGLFRKGERERIAREFTLETGLPLTTVDISEAVRESLLGVSDESAKRAAVHREILRALSREGGVVLRGAGRGGSFESLPLNDLFREEILELGERMGLSKALLSRQPFPESGLAGRVSGEVTEEKIAVLREADAIFTGEIESAGLDKKLWQYYAALTGTVSGAYACVLHALVSQDAVTGYAFRLPYDLIERTVMRAMGDEARIEGVLYDVTGR